MKTVALLGTGLMGGSVGLALREAGVDLKVNAYARRKDTREYLMERGIADEVFATPGQAVKDADLVIACVPVCAIPHIVRAAAPSLKPGAVVTDVGSTKAWLATECKQALADTEAVFIGSHPMCGSEKTGVEAAHSGLFQGSVCVVCGDEESRGKVWWVTRFWARLGCRVVEMPADEHDRLAARTSHVPHVVASALVLAAFEDPTKLRPLIGTGFRDTTRVAAGAPELWRDIVGTNALPVAEGLRRVQERLGIFADAIERMDLQLVEKLLSGAMEAREHLCEEDASEVPVHGVVAIDGPSASGKSTVARQVARSLSSLYVDSGAIYRGVTWKVLQDGVDPTHEQEVVECLNRAEWAFPLKEGQVGFTVDGVDPGDEIRGEAVRENVSYVARIPEVRRFVVDRIRDMRTRGPLVVEGRDIGSVVFPETPHKFYLDADPAERARRRNEELQVTESDSSVEAVEESLRKRDHLDSTRQTAPLQVADGARVMDTTHMSLEQVVEEVIAQVSRGLPPLFANLS